MSGDEFAAVEMVEAGVDKLIESRLGLLHADHLELEDVHNTVAPIKQIKTINKPKNKIINRYLDTEGGTERVRSRLQGKRIRPCGPNIQRLICKSCGRYDRRS